MKCETANSNSSTDFDVRLHFVFCGILFPQWRVNSVRNAKGLFIILDLIINQERLKEHNRKGKKIPLFYLPI